jgi:putative sterol carrier protein
LSQQSESAFTHSGSTLSEVGEVFKALPSRFQPDKVDKPTSFYFAIDDEEWTVIVEPDRCSVAEGKTLEDEDCFLKTSSEIFLGTIRGTYTPGMVDLVSGKVKTNNPFLLQTFKDIFG